MVGERMNREKVGASVGTKSGVPIVVVTQATMDLTKFLAACVCLDNSNVDATHFQKLSAFQRLQIITYLPLCNSYSSQGTSTEPFVQ